MAECVSETCEICSYGAAVGKTSHSHVAATSYSELERLVSNSLGDYTKPLPYLIQKNVSFEDFCYGDGFPSYVEWRNGDVVLVEFPSSEHEVIVGAFDVLMKSSVGSLPPGYMRILRSADIPLNPSLPLHGQRSYSPDCSYGPRLRWPTVVVEVATSRPLKEAMGKLVGYFVHTPSVQEVIISKRWPSNAAGEYPMLILRYNKESWSRSRRPEQAIDASTSEHVRLPQADLDILNSSITAGDPPVNITGGPGLCTMAGQDEYQIRLPAATVYFGGNVPPNIPQWICLDIFLLLVELR